MTKKISDLEPIESAPMESGVEFRIEKLGTHFIITRSQGGEFKPCGKNGLWNDVPHLYRNEQLATLTLLYFADHA
ncbi:hypothetical protein [Runella sp.]|uniref:hypothetical protein n=1 Tax=Runella sp. TaxID=1960881 RepID=UPI0030166020